MEQLYTLESFLSPVNFAIKDEVVDKYSMMVFDLNPNETNYYDHSYSFLFEFQQQQLQHQLPLAPQQLQPYQRPVNTKRIKLPMSPESPYQKPNRPGGELTVSQRKKLREHARNLTCHNCQTQKTPLWRRSTCKKHNLCNACGLYSKQYNEDRPVKGKSEKNKNGNDQSLFFKDFVPMAGEQGSLY